MVEREGERQEVTLRLSTWILQKNNEFWREHFRQTMSFDRDVFGKQFVCVPVCCSCGTRMFYNSIYTSYVSVLDTPGPQFQHDHFTEMCSDSEAGSYLRLIDIVSLNSRLEIHKQEEGGVVMGGRGCPTLFSEFGVQGSGFRVQGSGCRVQGVGCRVQLC